jgi:hypothetical protein
MTAPREQIEQSLLGMLLFKPDLARCTGLSPEQFFYPWNRAVFAAILEGGTFWDVKRRMNCDGTIENLHHVGREDYLAQLLVAGIEPVADFDDLVREVHRCHRCEK